MICRSILSHTVTPEIESVAQLKKYAWKKREHSKWNLVTGDKKEFTIWQENLPAAKDVPYSDKI